MSEQFWIKDEIMDRPAAVLKVGGRLGANPAKELRKHCASLRDQGYQHIVLNLAEVSFIASSGIGALIVLTGEFNIKGGSAQFVELSQPVERTIDLLNLGKFLTIEGNEEDALAKLAANK